MMRSLLPVLLLSAAAASPLRADVIRRTDGKVVTGVTILEETLAKVTYDDAGSEKSVPSDEVLWVEFQRLPRELDDARASLAEDDPLDALSIYEGYVERQIPRPRAREKWAPAYAAWQVMQVRRELADDAGVVSAADRLIESFPTSRYVPGAYLAKAYAQAQGKQVDEAHATLNAMQELVRTSGLSKRWDLECQLAKVITDTRGPEAKRQSLEAIAAEGERFPTVESRARMAEAETYMSEAADTRDQGQAADLREKARALFERVTADPNADARALAGAHTGLGECLFYKGVSAQDASILREASLHFLRVAVAYRRESAYMPKALFHAMRCFEVMGDKGRMRDMREELKTHYPDSPWSAEADKFAGR